MKDYSAMSDFEINCEVVLSLGAKDLGDGLFLGEDRRYDVGEDVKNKFKFDPCKSWSDAGPIIQENRISLRNRYDGDWRAENEWGVSFDATNINPLRAAMIVFLMMKDAESNV